MIRTCASRSAVHRRGPAASGRVHRDPLRDSTTSGDQVASGEIDFDLESAAWLVSHLDAGEPITVLAGVHVRLLRAVRARADPDHQRPEGQEGRHPAAWARAGTCCSRSSLRMSGSTRTRTSTGSPAPTVDFMELFAEGKVDAFLGVPARAAGAARPQDRSRDPQHDHGQAVVAVLLLHSCSATGTSSAIIRSPPSAICGPSSRPPTSAPPSRSGPRNGWSMAGSRIATTTRSRR